ncbi:hypothetical protein [Streptomyces mirabilis]|uniref:hypothetical protein n=1 Tax=Streptomyces mirabilis TaxID=68239 RepID=UPI0038045056
MIKVRGKGRRLTPAAPPYHLLALSADGIRGRARLSRACLAVMAEMVSREVFTRRDTTWPDNRSSLVWLNVCRDGRHLRWLGYQDSNLN